MKINKKKRVKRLVLWLFIDLVVVVTVFALLLHKPKLYKPKDFNSDDYRRGEVSPYLTHELLPKIQNSIQYGKPFDITITQEGINDIIGRGNWPMESEGTMLYAPAALFVPDTIIFMGTADVKGVKFVVTIEVQATINEQRLLDLKVTKMKVGAMNITPLAKMTAKKMYAQKLAGMRVDSQAIQTKIVASLLNDEPFEPEFSIDSKKKVRIEQISIENEQLLLHLVPTQ